MGDAPIPEGISSLLDTDLYKLTMQCAVLKYFPDVEVTYGFTNRTPDMKLSRGAYKWLLEQMKRLENITITPDEIDFLQKSCSYFNDAYLSFLRTFRLKPSQQIQIKFTPDDKDNDNDNDDVLGILEYTIAGLWVETILYEIPLLALTSEAYFKFCDTDWNYEGQEEKAYAKGMTLLEHGCIFSEFGSRRRRDYHTHDLVMKGLVQAAADAKRQGFPGTLSGTSNVHFAMKYGVAPVGTVAHEWYMGIAAYTNDYENANEMGLRYWLGCFGEGVLGIALTDTFGTPAFLEAFSKPIPDYTTPSRGVDTTFPSSAAITVNTTPESLADIEPPIKAPRHHQQPEHKPKTYAQVFTGVRQDSGDPRNFVRLVRDFYDKQGITDKKVIVFSDSLKVNNCLEYKAISEQAGFQPTFGVGTFFTNDFTKLSTNTKSIPLNIVIKISSAGGRPAVKLSDNLGKNTGDKQLVQEVKRRLGYVENVWEEGNEANRWGKRGD
ncbi:nicotinate phosphoribosyltransferase [Talaromyces stipitatus ATCC 10500]|uniref:nicotinate phosphoribosyltransferase n=1 Tax=Talaromyces stipitatus (strain ATCC 10500 / CBS 375.48 / QM 6759 / NRRL 1006) TaxID=441959 RepID=B8M124_TALSN|nr:nicotinate phosphoribosyltransferase [Talaromyces stipitatus ATCC 10500]EED21804.1 nicotinate phosphoribosyltransferase [Talaromyces stipitatus ATCC 10500]